MHLLPYLLHMALYVLNTTRTVSGEEKNLEAFLEQRKERWLEMAYVTEGPLYYATLCLAIAPPKKWKKIRVKVLQRLLLLAHTRKVNQINISKSHNVSCVHL